MTGPGEASLHEAPPSMFSRPSNLSPSSLQDKSRLFSSLTHNLLNFELLELFTAQNVCLICTLLSLVYCSSDSQTRRGHSRDATLLGYSHKECRHQARYGLVWRWTAFISPLIYYLLDNYPSTEKGRKSKNQ